MLLSRAMQATCPRKGTRAAAIFSLTLLLTI